jgi:uncharacterized delta-60 repeat protein
MTDRGRQVRRRAGAARRLTRVPAHHRLGPNVVPDEGLGQRGVAAGLDGSTTAARRSLRRAAATVLAGLELLLLAPAAGALPGQLDPTFAGDGTRTLVEFEEAQDVLVQPDGKIVVAGFSPSGDFTVARLRPDGTPDPSFDDDGVAVVAFGGLDQAYAVARQPDGKIVVAGFTIRLDSNVAVARLHPNGALDTSFHPGGPDGDGRRTIDYGGNDAALDVVVQPDGRIVVAGHGGPTALVVTRLRADGADDPSFDGDGTAGLDAGGTELASAVALQPDGKIVVAGERSAGDDILVARFNPTGPADMTLDATFGDGGVRAFGYGGDDWAGDVLVQPDGKLVVTGSGGPFADLTVTRLDPDSRFDATFDGDGTAGADFGSFEEGEAALLQPDGKIVVVGSTDLGANVAAARFNATGPADMTLDTGFSADGKTTFHTDGDDYGYGAALQADGKVVIAGENDGGALVARLQGEPPPGGPGRPVAGPGPRRGDGGDPAPRISRLSLSRARFAVTGRRRGTRIRFSLSETARVTATIERAGAGRRVRGRCRPAGRRGPRCTLWRPAGRLRLTGRQGANSKRFSGRIAGRLLTPGRYRLRLTAVDAAGQRSRPRAARFTVLSEPNP